MRCKDCKHYTSVRARGEREHGKCDNPHFVLSYHDGFGPNPDRPHRDQGVPSDGVLVEPDEGWGFYVGPDFGCVHWSSSATTTRPDEGERR